MIMAQLEKLQCIVCSKEYEDEPLDYCCNGLDCGCMGLPILPPCCSLECEDKVFGR